MKTQICTVGDVDVLRRWISLIANPLNCWAPVPLSQINVSFLENLGQTSGEYRIYRQNLGWSAKSKIPDRLRFSRHMKTRLNNKASKQYRSLTGAVIHGGQFNIFIISSLNQSPTLATPETEIKSTKNEEVKKILLRFRVETETVRAHQP